MNEWGLPNWNDKSAYGEVDKWTFWRWRWEFFRRRADVRQFFDVRANQPYQDEVDYWNLARNTPALAPHYQVPPFKPGDPGFAVRCTIEEAESFGYPRILDPRISEQPWHLLFPDRSDSCEKMAWVPKGQESWSLGLEPHQVAFAFSLDKPIADQILAAKVKLLEFQKERHGKQPQRRRHPTKWLTYLRVLDGREMKATWAEIAKILPLTSGTEQVARDTWNHADALRFNF